ncbi:NAD(P)/FAD-dependent oxidoreductase [Parasphingorhabdus litoris]|nr:NAD(P)/FAD-dependent oxidoreductase [Parasphingorhabdus litoris]
MESYKTDVVIAGAGVVGLAIARSIAESGKEVIILECENAIGTQTSSRNSEVVHAGIYYPQGSMKAMHCVAGNEMLYDYCATRDVGVKKIGKLIVAANDLQSEKLLQIEQKGSANGARNLRIIETSDIKRMEPNVIGRAAIFSPSTGIVDSHGLMLALLHDAESAGAILCLGNTVGRVFCGASSGFRIQIEAEQDFELQSRVFINAAGHGAIPLAKKIDALPAKNVPEQFYAKGTYFGLQGKCPFNHLVYPVPEPGGLGVHATIDLGGSVRFGPDVEWTAGFDVEPNPMRQSEFYNRIRRYWPNLPNNSLFADYCGVRPKIAGPNDGDSDFVISTVGEHQITGLINLFGIESPGLTSALSIAEHVCIEAAKSWD